MTGPTAAVRAICEARADGRCERCGANLWGYGYSLHHRRPRGAGGSRRPETNLPANLFVVCGDGVRGCHGRIESRRTDARREGWLVASWQRPSDVPVLYRGVLRRLHDDGSVTPVSSEAAS